MRGKKVAAALERLLIAPMPDVAPFLLTLYQNLFLCLPPCGVPFSAIWPTPPPPYLSARNTVELKDSVRALTARILETAPNLFVYGLSGVPSIAAQVFFELRPRFHCIWLDLEEQFNARDFAILVLDAIATAVGISENLPLRIADEDLAQEEAPEMLQEQLVRLIELAARSFIVFINGRDYPTRGAPRRSSRIY